MQNTFLLATIGAIAGQANAASLESQAEWGMPAYGGYGHSNMSYQPISYGHSHGGNLTGNQAIALAVLENKLAQQKADLAALEAKQASLEAQKKAAAEAAEKARIAAEEKAKKEEEELKKKNAAEAKRLAAEQERKAYEDKVYNSNFYRGYGSSIFDYQTDNVCKDNNYDGVCDLPGDEGCALDLNHDGIADCEDKDCDAVCDKPGHSHDPYHVDEHIHAPRKVDPYGYGSHSRYMGANNYSPYGARSYGGVSRYGIAGGYSRGYGSNYGRSSYGGALYGAGYGRTVSPQLSSSYGRYSSSVQKPASSVYKRSASYASPYGERVKQSRGYYANDSSRGMYGVRSYETKRQPRSNMELSSLNW